MVPLAELVESLITITQFATKFELSKLGWKVLNGANWLPTCPLKYGSEMAKSNPPLVASG